MQTPKSLPSIDSTLELILSIAKIVRFFFFLNDAFSTKKPPHLQIETNLDKGICL